MGSIRAEQAGPAAQAAVASMILDALDDPALLVQGSETILVANGRWRQLFADLNDSSALPTVTQWLGRFEDGEPLLKVLEQRIDASNVAVVSLPGKGSDDKRRFVARVTHEPGGGGGFPAAVIIMAELQGHWSDRAAAPQPTTQMHRLLVRQTLIEERERRRLGRAVHDHVTQLLVQVRRQLADARDNRAAWSPAETIADVDSVIRKLQELTSKFSPPMLEDLGLIPAMRWLAEHMEASYGAAASFEDDGVEPRLSPMVRTIAFRALRELAINGAKHAAGAQIVLSSNVEHDRCRLAVRDDGPGFDRCAVHAASDSSTGYGLLSVEQQVLAVGGTFELRSIVGDGTLATIVLPLLPESADTTTESRHDA